MPKRVGLVVVLLGACGQVPADDGVDGGLVDAPVSEIDAGQACRHDQLFGAPMPVEGVNQRGQDEYNAWLSADERTIVFNRPVTVTNGQLYVAHRASREAAFDNPQPLGGGVGSDDHEYKASLSPDGLTIYFDRKKPGAPYVIHTATRPSLEADFGEPAPLTLINPEGSSNFEPFITPEAMYFGSVRNGKPDADLYLATRGPGGFDEVRALDTINTTRNEEVPTPSADGLAVYYVRTDAPGDPQQLGLDIWLATRADADAELGEPHRVAELSSAKSDFPSWISPDNCRLYFSSNRDGDHDLYVAERQPE